MPDQQRWRRQSGNHGQSSRALLAGRLPGNGERRIAGAGLDVFDTEPLPLDSPLRALDNVVITPHLGYVSVQAYEVYFRDTVDDIRAFLDGKPVRVMPA